jgi:hypothetical protein
VTNGPRRSPGPLRGLLTQRWPGRHYPQVSLPQKPDKDAVTTFGHLAETSVGRGAPGWEHGEADDL